MHECSMYGSSSCAPSSPSPLSPSFDFCCSKKRGVVRTYLPYDELSSRGFGWGAGGPGESSGGGQTLQSRKFEICSPFCHILSAGAD